MSQSLLTCCSVNNGSYGSMPLLNLNLNDDYEPRSLVFYDVGGGGGGGLII